ncbi:MAG: zinc ribbon domain-containing protein [Deltaproteobacteria bacterium]|nr:zinc ribbon domain-containing protein [Deltaproteobacteria bacterium]
MSKANACRLPFMDSVVLKWEFECRKCRTAFEVDVPRGPKEERGIKCPNCNGNDIYRINIPDLSHTGCGG